MAPSIILYEFSDFSTENDIIWEVLGELWYLTSLELWIDIFLAPLPGSILVIFILIKENFITWVILGRIFFPC